MKLRDWEYKIIISRFRSFASDPETVCAHLEHPDGEELDIYFYLHETIGPNKLFWSTEYAQALYENNYIDMDEMRRFYTRIYEVRIAGMLSNEATVS